MKTIVGKTPENLNPIPLQRIGVLLPVGVPWANKVMRGIAAFARRKKSWSVQWLGTTEEAINLLARWQPHGILAFVESDNQLVSLLRLGVPVVGLLNGRHRNEITTVGLDEDAVGRAAAEHFARRGIKNFGCVTSVDAAHPRRDGFMDFVSRREDCQALEFQVSTSSDQIGSLTMAEKRFDAWLRAAPKPLGLFAVSDRLALEVGRECRLIGLRVPFDVAILGAEDDETVCEVADPMLSSVSSPLPQIGFEAAKCLAAQLISPHLPRTHKQFQPLGVTVRQSCDVCAVEDPEIAQVLRLIYGATDKSLGMNDLLKEVGLSRRALEQRFRAVTGKSPMAEVRRVNLERAARLLVETEESIATIAHHCGFSSATHLSEAFMRLYGRRPSEFRGRANGD